VLYSTTTEFLQHFGLTALNDLPPLNPEAQPALPEGDAGGVEILKG
jgi:chromosome segregation and condensation protein ScpB